MAKSNEQTMELSLSLLNTQDNQIEKYFNLENNIKTINRMGPYGNVVLHVASSYGYNEVVQLFLTSSALISLENISSEVVLYDESKIDQLQKLFLKIFNLHNSEEEIPDYDYIV